MTKYILIVFLLLGPLMASSPLPTDEALVKGTLDNGMKYIAEVLKLNESLIDIDLTCTCEK